MAMILHLQNTRVVRAEDFSNRFEISLRTVYRDMSALSESGVPIVSEAGVGYSLMKGYWLPPVMFTEEEAAAVSMAAIALRRTSEVSVQSSIDRAIFKIKSILPDNQRERLEHVESSTCFGFKKQLAPERNPVSVLDIQNALLSSNVLKIAYRTKGVGVAVTREIEPLGLVFYQEYWHLLAWCLLRRDYRDFRVDRIDSMKMTSRSYKRHSHATLQDHLASVYKREFTDTVTLKCDKWAEEKIRRQWSHGILSESLQDDQVVLKIAIEPSSNWSVQWLLSFGTGIRILEPLVLKESVQQLAQAIATHHQ